MTLFGAGHETTATTLTWAWYLLCQHPDLYHRMQHEVDTVLQGRAPRYEDLPQLSYCLQVFKETLHLYPPIYIRARQALNDVTVDVCLVRKGQAVAVIPYALHRRPDYFPDPETFDPDYRPRGGLAVVVKRRELRLQEARESGRMKHD